MRQIQMAVVLIAKLLFNKEWSGYQLSLGEEPSPADALYNEIQILLAQGEYELAEDELFRRLDPENLDYLELGLDLYTQLNSCSDQDLIQHGLPREEVYQGLRDLAGCYGLPVLL